MLRGDLVILPSGELASGSIPKLDHLRYEADEEDGGDQCLRRKKRSVQTRRYGRRTHEVALARTLVDLLHDRLDRIDARNDRGEESHVQ